MKEKVVVLLSGGLNSAVAIALALKQDYEIIALSVYYGQCHVRELRSAQLLVDHYCIEEYFLSSLDMHLWTDSMLTELSPLLSLQTTTSEQYSSSLYVPNRNMIFLSIALSLAEAKNATRIYIGTDQSGTDQSIDMNYHDFHNSKDTSDKPLGSSNLELLSGQNHMPLVEAPLRSYTKIEIMKLAVELDVPIDLTWSCCQCLSTPCGICSSCHDRNAALIAVGLPHMVTPMAKIYV
jgi:7-cyano-7-deazaguanine synthase